ncbi:membrane-spanning 4-domains subfamily A member 8-like [Gracilinanus agilis]|uniref:membrane-spanning 4-domains subfamily A member 8-like n=1 Tax=Gracilinanus agilis TaxID=191870 RepID=UPI001CFE01C1|nr:membrane-spanning 4-domains subfamily A member 8-like [Gracilinanus agilis]
MTSNPEIDNMFQVPPSTDSSMISSVPPYPTNQPTPPYPNNQPQVQLYPVYQPQMVIPNGNGRSESKVSNDGKVFGAIQILIGLLHIGFGSVLVTSIIGGHISISFWGGYPYWGGISFIISGTLSVIAQKPPITSCKINGSIGMNIVSAIFSAVGFILLITDFCINLGRYSYFDSSNYYYYYYYSGVASGMGISAVLCIFSALEVVISVFSSHAGCLATRSQSNQVAVAVAVPVPGTHMAPPTGVPQPAANSLVYSNEVNSQQ